jgi:type IV secretion system protein VirB10
MKDKDYSKTENGRDDTDGNEAGPRLARSDRGTKRYGKRVILFFILGVGLLLCVITVQAQYVKQDRDKLQKQQEKTYRIPQAAGFAELAAGMRREKSPVQVITPEKLPEEPKPAPEDAPRRIVVKRGAERAASPPLPRYYSNKNDAQAAAALRTIKLQALTAEPVAEGFKPENREASVTQQQNAARYPNADGSPAVTGSQALAALAQQQADPNGQSRKQNFLRGDNGGGSLTSQGYSDNLPLPQQFPYELKAGTIIPGIMLTGINSDLPGNVIGQVSENVWDTSTGKYVLIPKGTKILGVYDSQVTFGQKRVLLVWNRLVFPNGATLNIAGSPGIDQAGYAGLSGRVNEHWGAMLKAALLASVFVAGAEIIYDEDSQGVNENKSPRDVAAESAAGAIIDMGT